MSGHVPFTVYGMMKHVYELQDPAQDAEVKRMVDILPYRLVHFHPCLASPDYSLNVWTCREDVFSFSVGARSKKRKFTFDCRREGDEVIMRLPKKNALRPKRVRFADPLEGRVLPPTLGDPE